MDILGLGDHHQVVPKELIETSDEDDSQEEAETMDIPTTVTIVEADGTTSVVDDAVSSIVTDAGPNSSIQFGHSSSGGVTYRVVGMGDEQVSYQAPAGVQVLSPTLNGQYYVINSNEMLGRQMTSRSQILDTRAFGRFGMGKHNPRDDKKRATHNEVERRRRDKINGWIGKLAKIVPTCLEESTNKGQVKSKGGILAKACEYIMELKNTNCRLAAALKEHENTAEELMTLKKEINDLRTENLMLKQDLSDQQLGPTEEVATVIVTTSE